MSIQKKAFVDPAFDLGEFAKKSPYVAGFTTGLKAALVGGPVAATYSTLRGGKTPAKALALGALGSGLVFGLLGASTQNISNKLKEAELRWYLRNTKTNHPYEFLPPRPFMERAFPPLRPVPIQMPQTGEPDVY